MSPNESKIFCFCLLILDSIHKIFESLDLFLEFAFGFHPVDAIAEAEPQFGLCVENMTE